MSIINKLRERLMSVRETILPKLEFQCGCGQSFKEKQAFKEHCLGAHGGRFVLGSSHYLTHLTNIVLPCLKKERQEEAKPVMEVQIDREEEDVQMKKMGRSVMIANKNTRQQGKKQQLIWQGFVLVANDKVETTGQFVCGKCRRRFSIVRWFVPHCLKNCKTLDHPASSHFIYLPEDQQSQIKGDIELKQDEQGKKRQRRQGVSQEQFEGLPDNVLPQSIHLYGLFFKTWSSLERYSCVCQPNSKVLKQTMLSHVANHHSEILPKGSSHVILRLMGVKKGHRQVFMKCEEEDDGSIWFCACRVDVMMNRSKFVKHIMSVHKGISPSYQKQMIFG